ncbi:hypothetical protein [Nonomuraea sp. B1E8]|uniref:hypothetical protein n=1 Tax=unclassified Nonomuraea TaxID=2593643 RepID=UPI00325D6056
MRVEGKVVVTGAAGVIDGHGLDASAQDWNRLYAVNVLAHVYAARAAVPSMIARGACPASSTH